MAVSDLAIPGESPLTPRERGSLLLFLGALLLASWYRVGSMVGSDADEGVYVYAGRLIAEGHAVYRDFMLAHPPLLMLFVAAVWKVAPGLTAARVAYTSFIALGWLPLYGLARKLTRSHWVALSSVGLTACGYLYAGGLGRTVRLEPFLDVWLMTGLWIVATRADTPSWNVLAGAVLALATLVKLVALVPIGLFFLADLAWPVREKSGKFRRWALVSAGALLVLGPAWFTLLHTQGFLEWVVRAQSLRPAAPGSYRIVTLLEAFARFPPLPLGLLAAGVLLARRGSPLERVISVVALGTVLVTTFAFKSYARCYVTLAMPWCALALTSVTSAWLTRLLPNARGWLWPALAAAAGVAGPLAYAEGLERFSKMHVSGPKRVLELLKGRSGYVLTRYPDFALNASLELYPWYYMVDSFLPSELGKIGDSDFANVVEHCDSVVLGRSQFDSLVQVQRVLHADFSQDYLDANWEIWRRVKPAEPTPSVP